MQLSQFLCITPLKSFISVLYVHIKPVARVDMSGYCRLFFAHACKYVISILKLAHTLIINT